MEIPQTAKEIGEKLRRRGLTLGTVESATGGAIADIITDVQGSSDYFKGGIVAYSAAVKVGTAGVSQKTIDQHGVVSPQTAREMAQGGIESLKVDICLSSTGIAGPGGAEQGKPIGLFYIGLAHKEAALSQEYRFKGARRANKHAATLAALEMLKSHLGTL